MAMNRIEEKFQALKAQKKTAFIPFVTAGDPSLEDTEALVLAFEQAGADIVEIGVPFSDPLADGPTIQASSERALARGVNLKKILAMVKRIRRYSSMPIALMTYYNPIFYYGEKAFVADAQQSGVDGLIIPDLPPEEAGTLIPLCRKAAIANVFFLSPTTTAKRQEKILKASSGFVYYVALTGVTGARRELDQAILSQIQKAQKVSAVPICVGFGVSTPAQVKAMAAVADGVIVGSAIVQKISQHAGQSNLVAQVSKFVINLAKPLQ